MLIRRLRPTFMPKDRLEALGAAIHNPVSRDLEDKDVGLGPRLAVSLADLFRKRM